MARFVIVLGEDELAAGQVTVKDMQAEENSVQKQIRVPREELPGLLLDRLGMLEGVSR